MVSFPETFTADVAFQFLLSAFSICTSTGCLLLRDTERTCRTTECTFGRGVHLFLCVVSTLNSLKWCFFIESFFRFGLKATVQDGEVRESDLHRPERDALVSPVMSSHVVNQIARHSKTRVALRAPVLHRGGRIPSSQISFLNQLQSIYVIAYRLQNSLYERIFRVIHRQKLADLADRAHLPHFFLLGFFFFILSYTCFYSVISCCDVTCSPCILI